MKAFKTLSIFLLLSISFTAAAQDIRTFFKLLPMPYEWWLTDTIKDALLKKQVLEVDDLDSLNYTEFCPQSYGRIELDADVKNGYLRVTNDGSDSQFFDMCCWKCEVCLSGETAYGHIVAICLTGCDTNGCSSDWIRTYFVYPDGRFFVYNPLPKVSINDFFKDNATKKDIDDAYANLVYKLPRKGKNILVYCELAEGEGSSERLKKAKRLMKGNVIELEFSGMYENFNVKEPRNAPGYQDGVDD